MAADAHRRLLALAVSSQTALSVVQWGLGALGPDLAHAYHLNATELGALLSAGGVGNALALVLAGGVVDQIGPRVPLWAGGGVSGALVVLGGLAHSPWLLAVALFGAGVAGSFVGVAGTVSVFHGFAPERRGWALGVRQMSVAAGGLVASVMLPGLAVLGGVRLSLVASGVLSALFAVAFGLASPAGPLASHDGRRRVAPREVIRTPGMLRLLLAGVFLVSALTTVLTFAVPALRHQGASRAAASALFAVVSLAAMAARLFWGRMADRQGGRRRRATLRDVGLVGAAGALVYWGASSLGTPPALAAMLPFSFGALGFNGVLYVIAGELAGPDRAGQAVGFGSTVLFGGSALAAVPLGRLADVAGYQALWPAAAILALIGVGVTLGLPEPAPSAIPRT